MPGEIGRGGDGSDISGEGDKGNIRGLGRMLEGRIAGAKDLTTRGAVEPGTTLQDQAGVLPETANPGALDAEVEKVEAEAVQPLGAGAGEGLTIADTWMEKAFVQKTNYGAGESIKDKT